MDDTGEDINVDKQPHNNIGGITGKGFMPGVSGNPKGRPKGKTLKEFAREFLMSMTDEQKQEFLNSLSKDIVWRMAEGNPHQTTDLTSKGEAIIPIYAGKSLSGHNSDTKDISASQEDTGSIGGDISQ